MAITAGIAVFATLLRAEMGPEKYLITDVKGHATLGTALAFLNVFRSNLSYGRYWDGRGQLGSMVKAGRELMRKSVCYTHIPEDLGESAKQEEALNEIRRLINVLFLSITLALETFETFQDVEQYKMEQLIEAGLNETEKSALERAEPSNGEIEGPNVGKSDNKGRPLMIAGFLSHRVYYLYHRGWMNAAVLKKCDSDIDGFVGAWMACEKICGVPMVFPYTQMLTIFLVLFVYTFPLPLAHIFFNDDAEFNGFVITPFVSALVAFAFFGMNAVGIEIENPFGEDANDLPMSKMRERVANDTNQMLTLRHESVSPQMMDTINARQEAAKKAQEEQTRLSQAQAHAGGRGSFVNPR